MKMKTITKENLEKMVCWDLSDFDDNDEFELQIASEIDMIDKNTNDVCVDLGGSEGWVYPEYEEEQKALNQYVETYEI